MSLPYQLQGPSQARPQGPLSAPPRAQPPPPAPGGEGVLEPSFTGTSLPQEPAGGSALGWEVAVEVLPTSWYATWGKAGWGGQGGGQGLGIECLMRQLSMFKTGFLPERA